MLGRKTVHMMTAERKDTWAAGKLYEPYVGRWSRLVAKDFLAWSTLRLPVQRISTLPSLAL